MREQKMKKLITCLMVVISVQVHAAEDIPKGIITLDGRQAPSLVLNDLDGESWDISKAKGRWLFVHFWASWCGPCRREMPTIQAIYNQFDKSELEIVIINTAESEDTVFSFLASIQMDIDTLLDRDGLVTEQWQPRGLPSTFFVDPDGKLRYLALGGRPWDSPAYLAFLNRLAGK
jgi:cytochrome c biogenesis protein CcmG/thiol:disulfide interchange protein DsbE